MLLRSKSSWPEYKVADVAEINPENIRKDFPYDFIEYIDISSVEQGKLLETKVIPIEHAPSRAKRIVKNGDIIISTVRPERKAYWYVKNAKNNTVVSTGFVVIRPKRKKVEPKFLYYSLIQENFINYLANNTAGSAYPAVSFDIIAKGKIFVPPLPEQKAIAHILGTLDDKIELNRRMNETLEEMAKTIFKSWFVDFDPVIDNALEAGNPIPNALAERAARRRAISTPKLSPEIARLFPDSFEDSPLGPISKGWRVGSIKDIAILQRKNIKPFEYPEKIFFHYSIPSFDEGKVPKREKGKDIKSNKYLVPRDAVLISKLNPRIPRVWLPCPEEDIHAICSTDFFVLTPSKVSKEYLYCLLSSENFLNVFASLATGTSSSHQRVKPESLLQIELIIPQGNCIKLFTDQVFYIFQKIKQNEKEIQILGSLRDTLLPKLISGQIRIKDAEKFLEGI